MIFINSYRHHSDIPVATFLSPMSTLLLLSILLLALLLAGMIYYDRIRMKRVSYESVFMWLSFTTAFVTMTMSFSATSFSEQFIFVVLGLCAAGLERTLFGVAFHLVHSYEVEHEKYHARLRQKFLAGTYVASDDRFEVVTYSVVFLLWVMLLYLILPYDHEHSFGVRTACFFVGLTAEHLLGQRLRGAIQYNRLHKNENLTIREWTRKFEDNIEVYYFYHLLVHPQMCAGFSSPFWDTLLGRNPFASRVPFFQSLPIPFLDFFLVDYSADKPKIEQGWAEFKSNPVAFEERMLALSQQWRDGVKSLHNPTHKIE